MKLGLLNVHSPECLRYGIVGANGVAYLSSYLKQQLDLTDIFIEVDSQNLLEQKPTVVGISSTTENFSQAVEVARTIKEKLTTPIIIGGHHISALPCSLPAFIDAGVIGEGAVVRLPGLGLQRIFTKHGL